MLASRVWPFGLDDVIGNVTIDHSISHRPFAICFFRQFFGNTYRLVTIHKLQTTDRQTDGHNTVAQKRPYNTVG